MPHALVKNAAEAAGLTVSWGCERREEVIGGIEDEGMLLWWKLSRQCEARECTRPCCDICGVAFWVGGALDGEVGVEGWKTISIKEVCR